MGNPYADPELQKVLARKYQIATFTWADTDLATNVALEDIDIMANLLAVPNIASKLTQFRWLRADVVIEVRINATPFHIGALMVSYLPRCQIGLAPNTLHNERNSTLSQRSQNHGMVMSASTKNNLTIRIDREAATIFDPIDESGAFAGSLGILSFTVLNPLVNAGGGSLNPIDVSVFASFVEPKVSGYGYFPLASKIEPHSLEVSMEAAKKAASSIVGPEANKLFDPATVTAPLEALASVVSTVAPVAQFAASLGLSKPVNQSTTVPAVIDEFRDLNYGHGVTQATKLALHPNAGVGNVTMNGLKKNTIREFITKPMYLKTVVVDSSTAVDTPLDTLLVHPSLSAYQSAGSIFTPTPVAYASQAFECYRGGMKFRYEFITSQFVTARFRITHWPSPQVPNSIETYAGDAVSMIVDVRGDTNADLTVPYISPYPYQSTTGYFHTNNPQGYANMPSQFLNSFLTLSLINSMQQPDFAGSAVIYVNIYVSAAEDFVFGRSARPSIRRPLSEAPASNPKVEPHSLTLAFGSPFKPIVPATGTYEAGLVLPEQFTGVEEVCMRYVPITTSEPSLLDVVTPTIALYDLRLNQPINQADALTFWGQCYRWNRGGLRYKLILQLEAESSPVRYTSGLFTDTLPSLDNTLAFGEFIQDSTLRSVMEFEWPWPCRTYANSYWNEITYDNYANTVNVQLTLSELIGGAPVEPIRVYRAAADDFMFGHQIAVPILAWALPSGPSPKGKEKKVAHSSSSIKEHNNPPGLDQSLGLPDAVREKLAKYLLLKESKSGAQ